MRINPFLLTLAVTTLGCGREETHDHGTEDTHDHGTEDPHDHGKEDAHDHGTEDAHDHGSHEHNGADSEKEVALSKLSPADRKLAEAQGICPVSDEELGSMGTPLKVNVENQDVFICCEGCRKRLLANPKKYLAKLKGDSK